jgi:hypothetical protein
VVDPLNSPKRPRWAQGPQAKTGQLHLMPTVHRDGWRTRARDRIKWGLLRVSQTLAHFAHFFGEEREGPAGAVVALGEPGGGAVAPGGQRHLREGGLDQ